MKIRTTKKSHTQKDGTVWEWEETPELKEFIAKQQSKMENFVNAKNL